VILRDDCRIMDDLDEIASLRDEFRLNEGEIYSTELSGARRRSITSARHEVIDVEWARAWCAVGTVRDGWPSRRDLVTSWRHSSARAR